MSWDKLVKESAYDTLEKKIANGLKYSSGYKRCTYCSLFVKTIEIRCPCCNAKLRTSPRS